MANSVTLWNGKREAELSPELAKEILALESNGNFYAGDGGDDPGLRIAPPKFWPRPEAVEEAKRLLPFIPQIVQPVDRGTLYDWMFALNVVVRNPQDPPEFKTKFNFLGQVFAEYPMACFTKQTLHKAATTFEFFPAAADIKKLIDDIAQPLFARVKALERIANYVPPTFSAAPPRAAPTAEEKAQVAVTTAAWRAEAIMSVKEREDLRLSVLRGGVRMTQHQLLAAYEKELADGAVSPDHIGMYKIRIANLREQIKGN